MARRMIRLFLAAALLAGFAAAPARAQVGQGLEVENPGYLDYVVEELSPDALKRGLTGEALRARIEARLLALGITPRPSALGGDPYLYVFVNVAGEVFSVRVELQRRVVYAINERPRRTYAATWQTGGVGHSPSAEYIFAALDGALGTFLREYQAANSR